MIGAVKFDEYTRKARLQPCLISLLPIGLLVLSLTARLSFSLGLGAAVAGTTGLTFLLSQLGRDLGKKKEQKLWVDNGGSPTLHMLRHRYSGQNRTLLGVRHRCAERLIDDLHLPTEQDELENPNLADEKYDVVVKYLLAHTRDKDKFSLLFSELVNYGFRRNLWGLKTLGLAVLGVCGPIQAFLACFVDLAGARTSDAVCFMVDVALLFIWVFVINQNWVDSVSMAYAERLLECLQLL